MCSFSPQKLSDFMCVVVLFSSYLLSDLLFQSLANEVHKAPRALYAEAKSVFQIPFRRILEQSEKYYAQVPQILPTTHHFGVLNISDFHIVVDFYKYGRRDAIKCNKTIVVYTLYPAF